MSKENTIDVISDYGWVEKTDKEKSELYYIYLSNKEGFFRQMNHNYEFGMTYEQASMCVKVLRSNDTNIKYSYHFYTKEFIKAWGLKQGDDCPRFDPSFSWS